MTVKIGLVDNNASAIRQVSKASSRLYFKNINLALFSTFFSPPDNPQFGNVIVTLFCCIVDTYVIF